MTATPIELESAKRDALFQKAKRQFTIANAARFLGIALSIGGSLLWPAFTYLPLALLAITLYAEWMNYASDTTRGNAERVARSIDFLDGLGWPIDEKQRLASSALVRGTDINKAVAARRQRGIPFFDSTTPARPLRAVENTKQSSWYTAQLAGRMRTLMWFAVSAGLAAAAVYYFMALSPLLNVPTTSIAQAHGTILRTTSALISAILSLGLVRLAVAYGRAAEGANRSYESAVALMKQPQIQEHEAVYLLANYHTTRAGLPLIPDFIWKRSEHELNDLWNREVLASSTP